MPLAHVTSCSVIPNETFVTNVLVQWSNGAGRPGVRRRRRVLPPHGPGAADSWLRPGRTPVFEGGRCGGCGSGGWGALAGRDQHSLMTDTTLQQRQPVTQHSHKPANLSLITVNLRSVLLTYSKSLSTSVFLWQWESRLVCLWCP